MDLLSGGSVGSGVVVVAGVVGASMYKRKVEDLNLYLVHIIACELVQISAGDHGPFSDQPLSINFFNFLSKW